jgi:hypothetical protein
MNSKHRAMCGVPVARHYADKRFAPRLRRRTWDNSRAGCCRAAPRGRRGGERLRDALAGVAGATTSSTTPISIARPTSPATRICSSTSWAGMRRTED